MDIETVDARWADLPYMRLEQARFLRDFVEEHDLQNLLELGFFHGKSSAFLAASLEELGRGHLSTCDLRSAKDRDPPIEKILSDLDLSHRVTTIYAERSFTWELCKMLDGPRPSFDFCYLDGGHTWDVTGLAFMLVDLLLEPGGWVFFDDLDWTIAGHLAASEGQVDHWRDYGSDEKNASQVRKVWEILVPSRGYTDMEEMPQWGWGVARKPFQ